MIDKENLRKFIEDNFEDIAISFSYLICPATMVALDKEGVLDLVFSATYAQGDSDYFIIKYKPSHLPFYVEIDYQLVNNETGYRDKKTCLENLDKIYDQLNAWQRQALAMEKEINDRFNTLSLQAGGIKLCAGMTNGDYPKIYTFLELPDGSKYDLTTCEIYDGKVSSYIFQGTQNGDFVYKVSQGLNQVIKEK